MTEEPLERIATLGWKDYCSRARNIRVVVGALCETVAGALAVGAAVAEKPQYGLIGLAIGLASGGACYLVSAYLWQRRSNGNGSYFHLGPFKNPQ